MNLLRLRLDTLQFVRGLPTWLGFAAPEAKPPPIDHHEQVRIDRCADLDRMNEALWSAFLEFKKKWEEERRSEGT